MSEIPVQIKQEYEKTKQSFPKASIIYDAKNDSYFVSICTLEAWTNSLFLKKII